MITILFFYACKWPDQTSGYKVKQAVSLVKTDGHLSFSDICVAVYELTNCISSNTARVSN